MANTHETNAALTAANAVSEHVPETNFGNIAHPQATEPAWRPIETAPKDGSEILLGHPDGSMAVGWWREARSHGRVAGWSDGDDFAMTWPSHWKPKPAAPEAKQ